MDRVCIAWVVKMEDWTCQWLFGVYPSRKVAIKSLREEGYQWKHLPMFDPERHVYVKAARSPEFIWLEDYELDG